MKYSYLAALALTLPASLHAQAAAPAQMATSAVTDYSTATALGGDWTYSTTSTGSEATFANASAQPQLTVRCTKMSRRVAILKAASAAAPSMSIWTSTQTKNAPTGFDPATARLSADFAAYDPFLDAIAFSRGRVALSVDGAPALVVPVWSEVARVIEDCRI